MIVGGIDTSSLPPWYEVPSGTSVLILDGDSLCYVVAAQCAKLDTAIRRFKQGVLEKMFVTKCSSARIHLTAHDSAKFGRYKVIASKPYQGQRNGKDKPALLEAVREAVANPKNWLKDTEVYLHRAIEADDACMIDSYHFGDRGVLVSADKDLRATMFPWYDEDTATVDRDRNPHWVGLKSTGAGRIKLVGRGQLFFWAQMLAGDPADNVRGLQRYNGKDIGPAQAVKLLKDVKSIHAAADTVIDLYRAIGQNVVAEGWLLWLQRTHEDTFVKYVQDLYLSDENFEFVNECIDREWYYCDE